MDEKLHARRRSARILTLLAGTLLLVAYVLGYGWCRQQHILIHYLSDEVHTIDSGDGSVLNWWGYVVYRAPSVFFTPLRWAEAVWWQSRGYSTPGR